MITIREATEDDARGIAKVGVGTWRSAYRGIMWDEHLAGLSYSRNEGKWRRRLQEPGNGRVIFVAEDEQAGIVGSTGAGPECSGHRVYHGELYAIYARDSFQRKGIGRRFVQEVARRFARSGISSMLSWVLVDTPSRHFYEALGAQEMDAAPAEIGGVQLEEVAYGWTDVTSLCT